MVVNVTLTVIHHNEGTMEALKALLADLNSSGIFNFICQECGPLCSPTRMRTWTRSWNASCPLTSTG
jgi:hypothetical protein